MKLNTWNIGEVTPEVAIKVFGGAVLHYTSDPNSRNIRKCDGLEKIREEGNIVRFRSSADIGNIIDLDLTPIPRGEMGVMRNVHHIAWRAIDVDNNLECGEIM